MAKQPCYDATMLRDARSCAEFFRARHRLGLVKLGLREEPLDGGRAWHKALEMWFAKPESDVDAALAALRAAFPEEPAFGAEVSKRPLALYERTFRAYAERWPREQDDFVVARNERWEEALFEQTDQLGLTSSFQYGAIFDRDLRHRDGSVYVMDSKTTGGWLNAAYFGSFALSLQLRGQVALKRVKGERCDGAIVDAVHLNTKSPTINPEKDFARQLVTFPEWMLDAWARDVEAEIRRIEGLEAERGVGQRWPQDEKSCYTWNRPCPFLARCLTAPELAEEVEGFDVKRWEPWTFKGDGND